MRVLIVEDGYEYVEVMERFVPDGFAWVRAGDGAEAVRLATAEPFDAILLDMRFDRVPPDRLLGDLDEAAARFDDDRAQGARFLAEHQGTYVLEALRRAGVRAPAVLSFDFGDAPARFSRLAARNGPLAWVADGASPLTIAAALRALARG